MHLFDSGLPFAAAATLRHGDASVDDYRHLQARLGSERCVIVQPSSYGTDHRVLVAGLRQMTESARGVAVVTPDASNSDLETLAAHGVAGARFNLVQRGTTHEGMVGEVAARAARYAWHLQFHLMPRDLLRLADELLALPVAVVLDHFGRALSDPTLAVEVLRVLDQMLATGRVWLKLSAPYLASPTEECGKKLLDAIAPLISKHAERLVWGTDWPHVTESAKPDDVALLEMLDRCFPSLAVRQQVFVHSAIALYGF